MAVWPSTSGDHDWVNYSEWDNGWGTPDNTILSLEDALSHNIGYGEFDFNGTHGLAVWILGYNYLSGYNEVIQWSTWDNSSWSTPQNVSDELGEANMLTLEWADDRWIFAFLNDSQSPSWFEWYSWENDNWSYEGNLTSDNENFMLRITQNQNNAVLGVFYDVTASADKWTSWTGTEWNETVAFG